ncbi:aldo/keto reductase [Nonomuraea pusilla]|uniref:aldo/keto reductase n=1 Tax=Nonomuraea pusilla TaxID=46177 RepID=UPI000A646CD0|nr:aldo/keto reductase [Nonomuraea pusilla]
MGIIAGGVYNSGLLADLRPGAPFDYQSAPAERLAQASAVQDVCVRYNVPLKAAAAQFPFGHPAVSGLVIGARTAAEVQESVTMLHTPIPAEMWMELRSVGLLDPSVPTP